MHLRPSAAATYCRLGLFALTPARRTLTMSPVDWMLCRTTNNVPDWRPPLLTSDAMPCGFRSLLLCFLALMRRRRLQRPPSRLALMGSRCVQEGSMTPPWWRRGCSLLLPAGLQHSKCLPLCSSSRLITTGSHCRRIRKRMQWPHHQTAAIQRVRARLLMRSDRGSG
jgi:hypothetical protein